MKNNKGVIGVDVGVAILIFIMFVGVITMLFYNTSMSSIATERKATATDIAVRVIENINIMTYDNFIARASLDTLIEGIQIEEGYTFALFNAFSNCLILCPSTGPK